jgi:N-acetylmuramoyl-L-alanine amidase
MFQGVLKIGFAVFVALLLVSSLQAVGQTAVNDAMSKDSTKAYVIAIDPGHPSETSGGCAHHGLKEVEICWEVALRLQQLIAAEPTLTSVLTKPAVGTLVTNRERAEIANKAGAAIMVRLHCDSANGSGCTVYYPDKQGTVQGVTGPSEAVIAQSRLAAESLQNGLAGVLASHLKMNPIKTDSMTFVGARQGALTGSIFAEVPAVVVEMVYLNNASDAAFIKESAGQDLLARGILAGIKEFVSKKQR